MWPQRTRQKVSNQIQGHMTKMATTPMVVIPGQMVKFFVVVWPHPHWDLTKVSNHIICMIVFYAFGLYLIEYHYWRIRPTWLHPFLPCHRAHTIWKKLAGKFQVCVPQCALHIVWYTDTIRLSDNCCLFGKKGKHPAGWIVRRQPLNDSRPNGHDPVVPCILWRK